MYMGNEKKKWQMNRLKTSYWTPIYVIHWDVTVIQKISQKKTTHDYNYISFSIITYWITKLRWQYCTSKNGFMGFLFFFLDVTRLSHSSSSSSSVFWPFLIMSRSWFPCNFLNALLDILSEEIRNQSEKEVGGEIENRKIWIPSPT